MGWFTMTFVYCCNVGDEVQKQPRLLLVDTVQLQQEEETPLIDHVIKTPAKAKVVTLVSVYCWSSETGFVSSSTKNVIVMP